MRGGARPGAGRPSKADELKLLDKLSPMEPLWIEAMKSGLSKKDFNYVKLFSDYFYGKPKESVQMDLEGDVSHEVVFKVIRANGDTNK